MAWEGIVEQVSDLLPPTPKDAGRASLPVRMMVGLLYLKYAYSLSDDQALERWLESPYMQYLPARCISSMSCDAIPYH
jgi:IS5 family transposase